MLSVRSGQLQVPASRRQQSARWLASTEDRWLFVGIGLTWQALLGGLSTRTPAYPTSGSSRRSGGRARGRGKGTRRTLPYRRSPCLRRSASRVTDYGQRALASCPPGSSVPPSTPGGVIRRRTTDNGDTLRVTDRDPNEASISRSSAIAPGSRRRRRRSRTCAASESSRYPDATGRSSTEGRPALSWHAASG
jgi:hypothetical protein